MGLRNRGRPQCFCETGVLRADASVYVPNHIRMPEPDLWRSVQRLPANWLRAVPEAGR